MARSYYTVVQKQAFRSLRTYPKMDAQSSRNDVTHSINPLIVFEERAASNIENRLKFLSLC